MAADNATLPVAAFNDLVADLLVDEQDLATAIIEASDICDADVLAKRLVYIFERNNKSLVLITRSIQREVEETLTASVLFRGNSIASKMMTVYSRMLGLTYLKDTLWPQMSKIVNDDSSYEVDPTRSKPGEDLSGNSVRVAAATEAILMDILRSLGKCPQQFRAICKCLMDAVDVKFPDAHYRVVGGYFFLRFICPAIVSPPAYALCTTFPKKSSHRGLVLVAKLLQNLANNVPFLDKKEAFMCTFNDFIETQTDPLNEFFGSLAGNVTVAEASRSTPATITDSEYSQMLNEMYTYMRTNKDKILAKLPDGKKERLNSVMLALSKTDTKGTSSSGKKEESTLMQAAESVSTVLNADQTWDQPARAPTVVSIDLIQRVKTMLDQFTEEAADANGDRIDWARLASSIDFQEFTVDVGEITKIVTSGLDRRTRLTTFLNLYNVLMLHIRISVGPIPRNVFRKRVFFASYKYNIGGKEFSLDDIFHGVLRGNPRFQFRRGDSRCDEVISDYDPRVHFAVTNLNASSPVVRVYKPETVNKQLLYSAKIYCEQEVMVFPDSKKVLLPSFFNSYVLDFGNFKQDVFLLLALWLSENKKDALSTFIGTGKYTVEYKDISQSPQYPIFEAENSAEIVEQEQPAAAPGRRSTPAISSFSAPMPGTPTSSYFSGAASEHTEENRIEDVRIDVNELWVLNVDSVWNEAVRHPVQVSCDLLVNIANLCQNFMFAWVSVCGSQPFKDHINVAGELQRVNLGILSIAERKAFFINVYHALVFHLYVMTGPPTSVISRRTFFSQYKYNIGGLSYTLDDMESILSGNTKKFKKADARQQWVVEAPDPRIHFALSNLSASSSIVHVYTAETLDEKLSQTVRECMIQHLEVKPEKTKIYLPKVMEEYESDFGKSKVGLYMWAAPFIELRQRETIAAIPEKKLRVWFRDLDWTPQPRFEI